MQSSNDFSYEDTSRFVDDLFSGKSLSMLLWGLIAAKAKMGFVAATSTDSDTVQSSWKRVVKILVVVGILSLAQFKMDAT